MDELSRNYVKETTQLWKVLEKLKKHRENAVGEVNSAYLVVMRDILWLVNRETHEFVHKTLEMEHKFFSEADIRSEIAVMMSRFPSQYPSPQ